MATVKNTRKATPTTRKPVTVRKSAEQRKLEGNATECAQAVKDWRKAGNDVNAEFAPRLVAVAVRIANAPHGTAMAVAKPFGITESNEASRFAGAWKASLAYSARNGIEASEAFVTFFPMAWNVSNGDMLTVARSASSLAGATLAGAKIRDAKKKAVQTRKANGSILNGTKASKASSGKTGNGHAGTGDTSAESNGDKGDTVTDTLASAIHSLASRVSDAIDAGTLDAKAFREIQRFESVIAKARKAQGAKPVESVTVGK